MAATQLHFDSPLLRPELRRKVFDFEQTVEEIEETNNDGSGYSYMEQGNSRLEAERTSSELLCNAAWLCNYQSLCQVLQKNELDVNFQDFRSYTALHYACSSGDNNSTMMLLEKGSRVNAQDRHGNTALSYAAMEGNHQILVSLVEHGADVNLPNLLGETPLHLAAGNGHCDTVRFLLKNGASVNQGTLEGITGRALS